MSGEIQHGKNSSSITLPIEIPFTDQPGMVPLLNEEDLAKHELASLREKIRSNPGRYIISEGRGSSEFQCEEVKRESLLASFKKIFHLRTEAEKEHYRRGIDAARQSIRHAFADNDKVVRRFDQEFIKPKKFFGFSVASSYEQGIPLSTDSLLRFIEKEEEGISQKKGVVAVSEKNKLTAEEPLRIYDRARMMQVRVQDDFLRYDEYADHLQIEANAADTLAHIFYASPELAMPIEIRNQNLQRLYDDARSSAIQLFHQRNAIEHKISQALQDGSWEELEKFLNEKKPSQSLSELKTKESESNSSC